MKKILPLLCCAVFVNNAYSEALPQSTNYDHRIKNVMYNPDNVTRINVASGVATLIQFAKNEYISNVGGVGLGDAAAWSVNVKANNIWIKPTAEQPDTNLVVVTNTRTYQFDLVSVKNRNAAYWSVRFDYPKPIEVPQKPVCTDGTNYQYYVQGDNDNKRIYPTEVFDNGVFTCFKFPVGIDLPLIFKMLPDNTEGLVNYHIDGDFVVVHSINAAYRVRLGNLVIGIKTDNLHAQPVRGGTTNGKVRELLNDE